ncbi:MAG: glycosyltransferase [Bacteroidia bacterium]|jgi:glycosyltransferase involved in cell wall biosynthesis|nr:glycosyltransferase [Bacteroidia bacterium]MCC6768822.1 glycosyltransferase [Bacteroidia bacterium]
MPDISVVIPLLNEEESLGELHTWIQKVMIAHDFSYEIIFVDDGSHDKSWDVILMLKKKDPQVRGIRFQRNYGKSAALNEAFQACTGKVVITMDADLQDSPDEIPQLYKMIVAEGYDLVSGWKQKRYDPLTKTIPTKLFNWATRKMSGIYLHDFNCGLKAYKLETVKAVEVYGEMHRYIPVLAKWAGYKKIGEKAVQHQSRKYGTTKFGWNRFVNGFLDLLSITFVSRFGRRPMHLFGLLGTLCFFFGFLIAVYLTYEKFVNQVYRMTDRPIFYFGLLFMVIGSQLFLAGFLGELVSRNGADRNRYNIREQF